jgi:hypothetical protein
MPAEQMMKNSSSGPCAVRIGNHSCRNAAMKKL